MNTELVIGIAQIVTGIATLGVALFLAAQILLQRKALDRAHQDADRELSMSSAALDQELLLSRTTRERIKEGWAKRDLGLDNLSGEELDSQNVFFGAGFVLSNTMWRLGRLKDRPGYYIRRYEALMDSVAGREYYDRHFRHRVLDSELTSIAEKVYEDIKDCFVPA